MVLEDGEIIRRCLNGQPGMMDLLVDRYKTDLYSFCVRLANNGPDADDLFQDTWVKAMKKLESYNPQHSFRPWLFAICANGYRDLYRWRKRWWRRARSLGRAREDEGIEDPAPSPEARAAAREGALAVRKALDRLEDALRLPILLHYFQDFSVAEIAVAMDIPEGTVKTRLLRGREKLKVGLESDHER
jgi:RNA polymerase sigma-70 factor (ECF subfamily)